MIGAVRSSRVLVGPTIRPADILLEHDYIAAVAPYGSAGSAYDLGNRLIAPGLVDLHCDAVEKEIEPRPGAPFPIDSALVELDKKLAMTGITTMFHAIAFNEESLVGQRGNDNAGRVIERINAANRRELLVDNLVHARWEITSFTSVPIIKRLIGDGAVRILSFMDHSPGQGQFRSLETWKNYHMPVYELTEQQVARVIDSQRDKRGRCRDLLDDLARCARVRGVILASHDDDCTDKVDLMKGLGVNIVEFPLSGDVADYARQCRMAVGMGAPNVVRGRSQSGNIAAGPLVEQGLCDFLCADYHPGSLLQASYVLHRERQLALGDALALISSRPAAIAGLHDRGRIEPGALADLIVIEEGPVPRVVLTIKSGNPVYSSLGCFCHYEHAA
jgi:alpha-D-ribose 1-methylphosphonate 5-triphosphate diphosphatase